MVENLINSEIIELALSDKISFKNIEQQTGLKEKQVIKIMRNNIKKSSFKNWRKRVKRKNKSLPF